jgi:hypothetical protein
VKDLIPTTNHAVRTEHPRIHFNPYIPAPSIAKAIQLKHALMKQLPTLKTWYMSPNSCTLTAGTLGNSHRRNLRAVRVDACGQCRWQRPPLPEPLHEVQCGAELAQRQHAVIVFIRKIPNLLQNA